MTDRTFRRAAFAAATCASLVAGTAAAAPVDLSTWMADGGGNWVLQNSPANDGVLQTINGTPTVFFSPGNAQNLQLAGKIRVTTTADDDFIGFVLGYNDNDLGNSSADYLLIDWKQANQSALGCTGSAGLAISRVTGALGDTQQAWCHTGAGIAELARAANLGATGWADNTIYDFEIDFTATRVTVSVNGVVELDVLAGGPLFSNGSFGFYNYSQQSVLYSAIEEDVSGLLPEPGGLAVVGLALTAFGIARRRRRG